MRSVVSAFVLDFVSRIGAATVVTLGNVDLAFVGPVTSFVTVNFNVDFGVCVSPARFSVAVEDD